MGRIPAIDGLRAIAVLAVVAYHAGAPAGFVGVDVFFVISGYLITRLLMEDGRLVEFYARRARRILPAAFLCVAAALGLSFLLLPSAGDVARSAAAAGAFVANLFFQSATGDYWSADAASMPLLHLWSLSVEEQFYLAWPVVLIFARKRPAILWWVFGASLALYAWLSYADPNAAFYQTPARAWELTAGALVATGMSRIRDIRIGLPLVLFACLAPLPVPVAVILSVVGTAMVIAHLHAGGQVKWLTAKPMVYVGLISYSLYLWHWPLLALDRATRVGESPIGTRLALVAVAFVLAALSYRYVETPFRRMRVRPARAVAVGVACAVVLSTAAFSLVPKKQQAENPNILASEVPKSCHSTGRDPVRFCAGETIVWGDSMARGWSPLGIGNSRDNCPPLLGYPKGGFWLDQRCREFSEATLVEAQRARVILVAAWTEYPLAEIRAGLDATLGKLHGATIIGPTPILRDVMPRCLRNVPACAVPRHEFDAKAEPVRQVLRELAEKHGATYVEPVDYFCNTNWCPALRNGKPLYFDDRHVSLSAANGFRLSRMP